MLILSDYQDAISILNDSEENTFHVVSKKAGNLGMITRLSDYSSYVFMPKDKKYLKAWHLAQILNELNILNRKKE